MLFDQIQQYLNYTRQEQRGIIVLLFIILVLIILRISLNYQSKVNSEEIFLVENLETKEKAEHSKKDKQILTLREASEVSSPLKENELYDINTAEYPSLKAIGFPDFVINNLIKYRQKGGSFKSKQDLFKIYGVDTFLYEKVCGRIKVEHILSIENSEKDKTNSIVPIVELNAADTNKLMKLPGIGKVLSRRIIKYRELLGGFMDINQLTEVYGVDSNCLNKCKPYLQIDTNKITRINLNSFKVEQLYKHPYIKDYQAKSILKFLQLKDKFNTKEELRSNHIFTHDEYTRIVKYFVVK